MESQIFTPCQIGPVTLRNRVIRSAAFENMAYGNRPSDDLFNYHTAVAKGGVGMTTDKATGEVEEMWPGGLPFERCSGRG